MKNGPLKKAMFLAISEIETYLQSLDNVVNFSIKRNDGRYYLGETNCDNLSVNISPIVRIKARHILSIYRVIEAALLSNIGDDAMPNLVKLNVEITNILDKIECFGGRKISVREALSSHQDTGGFLGFWNRVTSKQPKTYNIVKDLLAVIEKDIGFQQDVPGSSKFLEMK